jgi:hypothetical protein
MSEPLSPEIVLKNVAPVTSHEQAVLVLLSSACFPAVPCSWATQWPTSGVLWCARLKLGCNALRYGSPLPDPLTLHFRFIYLVKTHW